jgi:tetratricopeptide (TPR) repeat protein
MTTHKILLITGLMLTLQAATAQSFKEQFNEAVSKKDTALQRKALEKWEKYETGNAELYVAYFNYFALLSRQEIIRLDNEGKGKDSYVLEPTKQDSTKPKKLVYLYGDTYYDIELLNRGIDSISKGIEKYPARLDMRFGKIYMNGQIERYEKFTIEIIKTINYSVVIKNQWLWGDNVPLEEGKNFMLNAIQDYQVKLYNTENDSLLNNMKRIAEAVLKHYPDHLESLSNLAIVYTLKNEHDKAIETLLKAEKLNPKDCIVLGNIAETYKRKGDHANAQKYYELIIIYGDEPQKAYAKQQIEELKKK